MKIIKFPEPEGEIRIQTNSLASLFIKFLYYYSYDFDGEKYWIDPT